MWETTPPDLCIPGIGMRPDFQELAVLSMMSNCGDLLMSGSVLFPIFMLLLSS